LSNLKNKRFPLKFNFSGKFAPKRDFQATLEQEGIVSTLGFLSATRKTPLDATTGQVKGKYDEPPLWIFPVAEKVNTEYQINILREDLESFHMLDDKTVTYRRKLAIRVLEPYELTESDAPGFLHLISITNVSLPHLLYRVHSVCWPRIRGFTSHLPLMEDPLFTVPASMMIRDEASDRSPLKDKTGVAKNSSAAKRPKTNEK